MSRHIIFIHGIGDASFSIAKGFEEGVSAELRHSDVKVHTFFWRALVSRRENELSKVLCRYSAGALALRLNIRDAVETYLIARLKRLMIGYFGDALFYLSSNGQRVRSALKSEILAILKNDRSAEFSIVAHSLGSVIAFDLLCDSRFQALMSRRRIVIKNFFTVGSPLALFRLRADGRVKEKVRVPIRGIWINIYDRRDIVGSGLSRFFPQCRDFEVKVHGANVLTAHLKYFEDADILSEILKKEV